MHLSCVFWLRVSYKAGTMVPSGASVISRFSWERIHFQAQLHGCWPVQLCTNCGTEVLRSSLATSRRSPSILSHMGLSKEQLTTWQPVSLRARETREQERKVEARGFAVQSQSDIPSQCTLKGRGYTGAGTPAGGSHGQQLHS